MAGSDVVAVYASQYELLFYYVCFCVSLLRRGCVFFRVYAAPSWLPFVVVVLDAFS